MTTIVEQLAGLSAQIRYETLPPAVVRKARMTILDTLGCALGGCSSDPAKAMRRVVRQLGGNPEATILGTAERTSVLGATWANGTSIRYLDYNDTLMSRDPSHPSGNLASVLAMAEAQGLDGRELICGLVNAYEVQLRLVDHCGEPCLWTRGWDHPTNMVYGSAAAAVRLLKLPVDKIAHTFPGDPQRPMTEAQAEKKFRDQARPYLTAEHIRQVIDAVWALERLEHAGDLARLVVM